MKRGFLKAWQDHVDALKEILDDLQSQWDDHSERWQEGERGEEWQSALDEAGDAIDTLNLMDWPE